MTSATPGVYAFTGSRNQPTPAALDWLRWQLENLPTEMTIAVHGDCVGVGVGADAAFHDLVRELHPGVKIHGFPTTIHGARAHCKVDVLHEPQEPLVRNRMMVDAAERLIGLPDRPEYLRSGTWSTIRYAIRVGRPVLRYPVEEAT